MTALVEALPMIRHAVPDARLVLPGRPTAHEEELRAVAAARGVRDAVDFPSFVSPEDLEGLYEAAACFAFPSFVEGFGLPILEAMRRGLPVACASASAPAEVAGEAALFFDPNRPQEAADAVVTLLRDPKRAEELAARGRGRAAEYSWRRTAERTLESWDRALSSGGPGA